MQKFQAFSAGWKRVASIQNQALNFDMEELGF